MLMKMSLSGNLWLTMFFLLFTVIAVSETFQSPNEDLRQANEAYEKSQYEEAVGKYEGLLKNGFENASLYYNLGNAYFRAKKIGKAILAYEHAKRLAPGDSDIKYNLEYASSFVKETPLPQEPLLKLLRAFDILNVGTLTILNSVIYYLLFAGLTVFLIFRVQLLKKFLAITTCLFFIFIIWFGVKIYAEEITKTAIVMQDDTQGRSGPDESYTVSFTMPEGKKVRILNSREDWYEIETASEHLKGWVKKEQIEPINP